MGLDACRNERTGFEQRYHFHHSGDAAVGFGLGMPAER
jgi:hypothetical protein